MNSQQIEEALIHLKANGAGVIRGKSKAVNEIHALSLQDQRKVREIFQWLLGMKEDFPERQPGQGQYYWREQLRRKLIIANIDIID